MKTPPSLLLIEQLVTAAERLGVGGREAEAVDALTRTKDIVAQMMTSNPSQWIALLAQILKTLTGLCISLGRGDDARVFATTEWNLLTHLPAINDLEASSRLTQKIQGHISVLRRYIGLNEICESLSMMCRVRLDAAALTEDPEAERIRALRSLAMTFKSLDRHEQAMDAIHQAEIACRSHLATDFLLYGSELCQTLAAKTSTFRDLDREAVIELQREVVNLRQRLAQECPTSQSRSVLAGALATLGVRLEAAGHTAGSVTVTEDAVAIRRKVAQEEHGSRWRDLAGGLGSLADRQIRAGSPNLALTADAERIAIIQRLAASDFRRYGQDLAGVHIASARLCAAAGLKANASRAAHKAVSIARGVDQQNTTAIEFGSEMGSDLSKVLAGAGLALAVADMHVEGLPLLTEALEIRRKGRAADSADEQAAGLLRALGYVADTLAAMGHWKEALPLADEAFAMSAHALLEFPEDRSLTTRRRTDTEQFHASLVRLHGILRKLRRFNSAQRISASGLEMLEMLSGSGNVAAQRLYLRKIPAYSPTTGLRKPGSG